MFREKINQFLEAISKTEDAECADMIEELVASVAEYVKRVNVLEAAIVVGKYNKEGQEYRENVERLDRNRSSAHNNLIANVKALNRVCKRYGLPLLFLGNEEQRIEIAEFAIALVSELFETRRL